MVQNSGYVFVAIVLFGICCASQLFAGELGQAVGFLPSTVQAPTRTAVNLASGLTSLAGFVILLLAFFARPSGMGGGM